MSRLKTLKAKIIIMLILASLAPVLITGISSYMSARNILNNKLETTSSQTIQEITRGLENYLNAMSNMVYILAKDDNIINADDEQSLNLAKELILNMKESDESIVNAYVGTEQGLFYVHPMEGLPEGFDPRERDWYKDAIQNSNKVIITDPYVDTGSGSIVISMVRSVLDGTQTVGVAGIDIDLASLSRSYAEIKIGDSGYIFITDRNGNLISHPDTSLLGTDAIAELSLWTEIEGENQGFASYVYSEEDRFASYDTSELTGWKIVATMGYAELGNDISIIRNVLGISMFVIAVISIITALLFSRPISRNIKKLVESFEHLSKGDLTGILDIRSTDEFQLLRNHFNTMAGDISKLIGSIYEASDMVLDNSISLSNMTEECNASITEVTRAIEEVAIGASEQAKNSTEAAMNVSELAEKLDLIEDSTNIMGSLSKNANSLTVRGLTNVNALIDKSGATMKSTIEVSELVYETSESIKHINEISNTIDAITAQTGLLALNASIEAARAGESGKGFAVVAEEIRKLSDQSKASTIEIKNIIEDINEKTALSVEAMEATTENVKEQEELVMQTREAFREIADAVTSLSNKVTEIQSSTNEIIEKKDRIVDQIENISAISEETASATEEVTASSQEITATMDNISKSAVELQELSHQLQKRLNSFKIQ